MRHDGLTFDEFMAILTNEFYGACLIGKRVVEYWHADLSVIEAAHRISLGIEA
jgi:hypothetical protein